jgi:chemotaxis protein MotB
VRYAIEQGIPPNRLAAAGFADTQPIDPGNSEAAFRHNRRIELKLTER